jgi:hypothetical protein
MPTEMRVLFSLGALVVVALAAWSLRPTQQRAMDSRWFYLRRRDPFFYLLFNASGYPRKFAWCFPVLLALLSIACIWSFPSP